MSDLTHREVAILNAALELPVQERTAYLQMACASDATLRQQVEGLLQAHEQADRFLETPPNGLDKTLLVHPPLTEKPGDRIGHYKLLQQIGEGGCGVVYMAEQEEPVRRRVALKVIKLGMGTKQVVARFEAERQALALMDHPNIAKVLDAGATETGRPYFVMELVRGIKITEFCDENKVPTEERLKLFIQICHAIQHAHQKGIIHRDIKPSNILVTINDGVPVPKVIDFGIAKATAGRLTDETLFTAFEQFLGTPAYMSPEQAVMTSLDIDTRSDIYSLGVLLYELLTGKTPVDSQELFASGLDEMRRTIRETEPQRPSTRLSTMQAKELSTTAERRHIDAPKLIHLLRGDLDWIVMKCLEKDRGRRYETANGLARDIERHLKSEPVSARPPSALYRLRKAIRRNKTAFGAAAGIAAVLFIGMGVSTSEAIRASRAQREQVRLRQTAEAEKGKSQQVAEFLKDMLKGVGPSAAMGRDTTMLKEILEKTANRMSAELKDQPQVQIELMSVLADTYHELGSYREMEQIARVTVTLARTTFGQESLPVAEALTQLGDALQHLLIFEEGEIVTWEALALHQKLRGKESLGEAAALHNLSAILRGQWRLPEAEAAARESLAIRRKLLGEEHLDVCRALDGLAWVLDTEGKMDEAEVAAREALRVRSKIFGEMHPEYARSLSFLAGVLMAQAKYVEAERCQRQAYVLQTNLVGDSSWVATLSLTGIAAALKAQNRLAEAEALYRQALPMVHKSIGEEHAWGAGVYHDLSTVLRLEGKPDQAQSLIQQLLQLESKLPDSGHPEKVNSFIELGGILQEKKQRKEACAAFENAVILCEHFPRQAEVWRQFNAFEGLRQTTDSMEALEPRYARAVENARAWLTPENPWTAMCIAGLSDVLCQNGKLQEARALAEESVAICRRHADTFQSWEEPRARSSLAAVLTKLGDTDALQKLEANPSIEVKYPFPKATSANPAKSESP